MPELVRRRATSRGERLFQVLVAVLAGMATMYCLQNLKLAREFALTRPVSKPAPAPAPAEPEPELSVPEPTRRAAVNLPKSNMLVKPEPGGVKMGVQAVFGEQAPPEARKALIDRREGWREVKLQSRPMTSRYGVGVTSEGSGFKPIEHRVLAKPRREVQDKEIVGATAMATVEKTEKPAENLVASILDPEVVVEKPFWTQDRALRVGGSALIAIAGFLYLMSAGGVFAQRKPERAEGEM